MTSKDRRQKLSKMLHDILGSDEVYYDPPESIKMKYPAIVYTRAKIDTKNADNRKYLIHDRYEVTFIHKDADNPLFDDILQMPFCSFDRPLKVSNLYHDIFTIYIQ